MEYWDRYRFMNKGYSLNIQRLECEDQGTYVCKAINGFGVHEISFQLDLLGIRSNKLTYIASILFFVFN